MPLSYVNYIHRKGKNQIGKILKHLYSPKEHCIHVKNYPLPEVMFQLSHLWANESGMILNGLGDVERDDFRFFAQQKIRKGHIFDIGANIGLYSLFFKNLLPTNGEYKVYSFEPIQSLFIRLFHNIVLNNSTNSIVLEPYAVHSQNGMGSIFLPLNFNHESGSASMNEDGLVGSTVKLAVPAITLDEYCTTKMIQEIALIKIDVEGNEEHVIKGAQKVIKQMKPSIFFEVNKKFWNNDFNNAFFFLKSILEPYGYRLFFQDKNEKIPIEIAIKESTIRDGNWWAENIV